MGKRSRRKARASAALAVASSPGPKHSLPDNQRMARVNVEPELWAEFRRASAADDRSVADYHGHLVEKELRRVRRRQWRESASGVVQRPEPVTGGVDTESEVM